MCPSSRSRRRHAAGSASLLLAILSAVTCKKKGGEMVVVPPPEGGHVFVGYGTDDRTTPEETEWAMEARTVAAVVPSGFLIDEGGEYVLRDQLRLAEEVGGRFHYPPCSEPPFRFADRYVLPWVPRSCSAIAVSPSVVLTARHCILDPATKQPDLGPKEDPLAFVFGFSVDGPLRTREVHRAVAVREIGKRSDRDDDWAFVEVSPPIAASHLMPLSPATIESSTKAAAIGHPNHLGLLVSSGSVGPHPLNGPNPNLNPHPRTLLGDLDVADGSSGGPVFASGDHRFLGIVYAGDGDNPPLEPPVGACVRELWCEQGLACPGMRVVAAERFLVAFQALVVPP